MLSGLILAGGLSSRMGRDKALLALRDGRTLLQRQADVLREAGVTNLLLSIRPGAEQTLVGATIVADAVAGAGPLAGIAAGLRAAHTGLVLALAVDMPQLDHEHLRQLLALASPEHGVVPVVNGQIEPLVAIYPAALAASAESALAGGEYGVQVWVRSEAGKGALLLWDAPPEWAEAVRSWNAPSDLPEA
jgi:molybdopterin-guanine dinucleotide biosynthesis protein A